MTRPDYAREIRGELRDPKRLCEALGIDLRGSKRQAGDGLVVRCPNHEELTPSCSITRRESGTIGVRCFGCDWSGDALDLVALVRQIPRSSFRDVLAEAAEIANRRDLADEIRNGSPAPDRPPPRPLPAPEPSKPYPSKAELRAVWERATPVTADTAVSGYLVRRKLDPELVAARDLARVLRAPTPEWAMYGRRTWLDTGHRMIVPVYDAWGNGRSVRACRVVDGDTPKRLPPKDRRAAELVLANRAARAMLRGDNPGKIMIAEGEPDFLVLSTVQDEDVPVLGIGSGSWTDNFAAAIPRNADVYIYTDPDPAGDRYAAKIIDSLGEKCRTWRCTGEEDAA